MGHFSAFATAAGVALAAATLLTSCGNDGAAGTYAAGSSTSATVAMPDAGVPGMPEPKLGANGQVDQCKLMLDILDKNSGTDRKAFVEVLINTLPQSMPNDTQAQRDAVAKEWRKAAAGKCD